MLFWPPSLPYPEAGVGAQGAFYHKASRTLMVTDAVVYVPDKPPEVRGTVCSHTRTPWHAGMHNDAVTGALRW